MFVKIFTDGAARGNPEGPGGYGTVLQYIDGKGQLHEREFSAGYKKTTNSCSKVIHKNEPPEMDGFYYFSKDGGSFGKRTSSKLSNGPFLPERWSLVYSAFSSTSLSISFLA